MTDESKRWRILDASSLRFYLFTHFKHVYSVFYKPNMSYGKIIIRKNDGNGQLKV